MDEVIDSLIVRLIDECFEVNRLLVDKVIDRIVRLINKDM